MMNKKIVFLFALLSIAACGTAQNKPAEKQSGVQSEIDQLDSPAAPAAKAPEASAATPANPDENALGDDAPAPKGAPPKVGNLSPADSADAELYQRFNSARVAKNMTAATEVAGEILTRNPNDVKVLNALSVMAIDEGKYDLARLMISKVFQKEPTNAAALNNLGVIELKQDNLRLALIQFKKSTEADARNRFAHANLGAIYLQYRNYPNAVVELEAATENGDQSPATLSNLGFAETGAGDFAKAEGFYEKALAKDSGNVSIMLNYAALLVDHNMSKEKAVRLLNKIRFVAHEPAILNRVEALLRKTEGGNKNAPEAGKGDLE